MEGLISFAAIFGIYAALIFDIFSTTNSSPQTTQMFASERAATLWRWVRVGAIISVLFIIMGAWLAHKEGRDYRAPILGGLMALGIMWYLYSIALKDGGGKVPDQKKAGSDLTGPGDW
jgi:heme A synthase